MAGAPIQVLNRFLTTTGPSYLKSDRDIVNAVTRNTYLLPRLMAGKQMSEMLQGGSEIRDVILLALDATYRNYSPVSFGINYDLQDFTQTWTLPYRFSLAYAMYGEHELEMNDLSESARHQRYKDLRFAIHQHLMTDLCNGMEDDLWAVPDATKMEVAASGDGHPYSFFAGINEFNNGLFATAANPGTFTGVNTSAATYAGGAWTTFQNISPTTYPAWRCAQKSYNVYGAIQNVGGSEVHLFRAFSRMYHALRFDRLPKGEEYSDPTTKPTFIAGSEEGISNYEFSLQASQDHFTGVGKQDPAYDKPTFRSIPLEYVAKLDTVAAYPTGTSGNLSTEADTTSGVGGPRYFFVNGRYYNMVWQKNRFFYMKDPFFLPNQPFNWVLICDNWRNLVNRSPRNSGIVAPSATVSIANGS